MKILEGSTSFFHFPFAVFNMILQNSYYKMDPEPRAREQERICRRSRYTQGVGKVRRRGNTAISAEIVPPLDPFLSHVSGGRLSAVFSVRPTPVNYAGQGDTTRRDVTRQREERYADRSAESRVARRDPASRAKCTQAGFNTNVRDVHIVHGSECMDSRYRYRSPSNEGGREGAAESSGPPSFDRISGHGVAEPIADVYARNKYRSVSCSGLLR